MKEYLLIAGLIIIICVLVVSFYRKAMHIWEGIKTKNYDQIKADVIILIIMLAVLIVCFWLV